MTFKVLVTAHFTFFLLRLIVRKLLFGSFFQIICGTRNASQSFSQIGLAAPWNSRRLLLRTTLTTTLALWATSLWNAAGNLLKWHTIIAIPIGYSLLFFSPVGNSARYSFVNCIHNSARLKCNQQSVAYVRKAARILTDERYLDNCRHLEVACAAAGSIAWLGSSLMPLVTVLILRIVSW